MKRFVYMFLSTPSTRLCRMTSVGILEVNRSKGGVVHAETDKRITIMFEEAESMGRCLVRPVSSSDQRAVLRRLSSYAVSPLRGLYARRNYWDSLTKQEQTLHMARSLALLHPTWVFCGPTAAVAHGLDTPRTLLDQIYVVAGRHSTKSISRIKRHSVAAFVPVVAQGIPVTPSFETAIDSLTMATFPEGLAIADSALRSFGFSRKEFQLAVQQRVRGKHGSATARRVARFASSLSENGGESYARGIMIEEGFCIPRLQVEIPDPLEPGSVYRVDYYWKLDDGTVVVGELDGVGKLADPQMLKGASTATALRDERTRESRLSLTGAKVMRFSFRDVLDRKRFARTLDAFGIPRK